VSGQAGQAGFGMFGGLGRYARLLLYFTRFSASKYMQFRVDFFFRIGMDVIYYVVNIAFYRVLYLHTPLLAGWTEAKMMVFVSGYLLIDAITMTLFTNNQWMLPTYVNRGDLDYYLIRPVSSLFFLSLRDIAINSFVNFVMAAGILVWAISRYPAPVPAAKIALFLAALGVGVVLQYSLSTLFVLPVFWTHSVNGFRMVYWSIARFIERPDGIFHGWARRVLTVFLPLCVISSFPAKLALEDFRWETLLQLVGLAAFFFGLVVVVWRVGLRSYSSASS
jgi:ABC-2 type transport system permease protein